MEHEVQVDECKESKKLSWMWSGLH